MVCLQTAIGIDFGGTYIKGALLDEQGVILAKDQIATLPERGAADILQRIGELAQRLAKMQGLRVQEMAGIGLGIPGFIDDQTGYVVEVVNIGWSMVNVREPLQSLFHVPVVLENDANCAALGEAWIGAGRNSSSALCITLGTGVGGGIVLEQRIWRGVNHMAGEIGHLVMDPEGSLCNCGRSGCLETYSSATGLLRLAKAALHDGIPSRLTENTLSPPMIFRYAKTGDELASTVVAKSAEMLGRGLALAANLINPEVIIVGGGLAQAGEVLMQPVRSAFMKYALPRVNAAVRIVPALLGNDAGVVGAGRLVLQN